MNKYPNNAHKNYFGFPIEYYSLYIDWKSYKEPFLNVQAFGIIIRYFLISNHKLVCIFWDFDEFY